MPPNRKMRRQGQRAKLRSRPLTSEAADHLYGLMKASIAASSAYTDAAQQTVRAMGLPAPKEGHIWLVDPNPDKRVVSEHPRPRR